MERIATRVTALLGTSYPIVQGGMIWVAGWKLARAVSDAGGLGLIGSGSMSPDLLREHITKLTSATDAPFGVNVPIFNRHADAFIEVCIACGVKIVFTSAGSPGKYTARLKDCGVTVVHVVPSARLAQKAAAAGCDAVVAEGTEAGGHNGFEELTSMSLWPAAVDAVPIPVIAAGGIVDGRGMAAALATGAEGVQLGTRFAVTVESSASEGYKAAAVKAAEADAKLYLRRYMPTRALVNPYVRQAMDAEAAGAATDVLDEIRGRGRARRGIFEGDAQDGEMEIGQAVGRIGDIPTAAQVVARLVSQYVETIASLNNTIGSSGVGDQQQLNRTDT
ncbi:MAG: nitronate monooxygenase [Myxococcota bacterium]|nr:nitronate monooxygenase [Myxococcota bacterium]